MSKSLAIEYAKKNININCISPGFIKTSMTDKLDDKFKEAIISKIPSARLGDPDDIAKRMWKDVKNKLYLEQFEVAIEQNRDWEEKSRVPIFMDLVTNLEIYGA